MAQVNAYASVVLIFSIFNSQFSILNAAELGEVRDGDKRVIFRECTKCPARMRFDNDANTAYVNVSRLIDDAPDAATLEKRKTAAAERAFALMCTAEDSKKPNLKRPTTGWSSWNTLGLNISDELIIETAEAMATNGLKAAGYQYVNIDDGFFDGHDENGILRIYKKRFPGGMKRVVDRIHELGLKAGTYSDAGRNTCGSRWQNDVSGQGAGLYGHDAADCKLHFIDFGFDFIKVDYCGGDDLRLDEKKRYTEIFEAIKATGRKDVRFNVCRWAYPGTWVADVAGSWRTTGDIGANWGSVKYIIGKNLYLSAFAKAGAYNDMDMLEVGRYKKEGEAQTEGNCGLTEDEECTHFAAWCMFSSPLLIGCDVRTIPETTKALITNPYLLAVNQNDLGLQAYVAKRYGEMRYPWTGKLENEAYLLVKDAVEKYGKARYAMVYNPGDTNQTVELRFADVDLGGKVSVFDLVERADYGEWLNGYRVEVPAHGARIFRLDAERRLERTVYEAETAYLTAFQDLDDKLGTARAGWSWNAPGGHAAVTKIGNSPENDLIWKNVYLEKPGKVKLTFYVSAPDDWTFYVSIDGGEAKKITVSAKVVDQFKPYTLEAELSAGEHTVRYFNPDAWAPDVDRMTVHGLL